MIDAENKVIAITGASAGLGKELALEAGRRKARVVLMARNEDKLNELAGQISSDGGKALAIGTDVTRPESVNKAFERIHSEYEQIDLLYNVAGVVEPIKRLEDVSDEGMKNAIDVNVLGLYLCTRNAIGMMLNQKEGGTIINITSGAAIHPYVGWTLYCSTKAAVDMFTKTVDLELSDTPIRIAGISPGPFESHMQQVMRKKDEHDFPKKQKFVDLYETGALTTPDVIAPMILDVGLSKWKKLSGKIYDIRDPKFQKKCKKHDIEIPKEIKV